MLEEKKLSSSGWASVMNKLGEFEFRPEESLVKYVN
jgi:hypothetical protein